MEDTREERLQRLQEGLLKGKKVISKVERGNYDKGNIDPTKLNSNNIEPVANPQGMRKNVRNESNINKNSLEKSKIPKNILDSFKDNPPVPLETGALGGSNDLFDSNFINEMKSQSQPSPTKLQQSESIQNNNGDLYRMLKNIIEETVKKTVVNVINEMRVKQEINENFKIVIGEKEFIGKITSVNQMIKE